MNECPGNRKDLFSLNEHPEITNPALQVADVKASTNLQGFYGQYIANVTVS